MERKTCTIYKRQHIVKKPQDVKDYYLHRQSVYYFEGTSKEYLEAVYNSRNNSYRSQSVNSINAVQSKQHNVYQRFEVPVSLNTRALQEDNDNVDGEFVLGGQNHQWEDKRSRCVLIQTRRAVLEKRHKQSPHDENHSQNLYSDSKDQREIEIKNTEDCQVEIKRIREESDAILKRHEREIERINEEKIEEIRKRQELKRDIEKLHSGRDKLVKKYEDRIKEMQERAQSDTKIQQSQEEVQGLEQEVEKNQTNKGRKAEENHGVEDQKRKLEKEKSELEKKSYFGKRDE